MFPQPADPTHFLGGCSTILLSWWVIKVVFAIAALCVRPEPRYVVHVSTKKNMWLQIAKKTPNPLVYRHLHPPSLLKWPTKWAIPSSFVTYPCWYPNRNCPLRIKKAKSLNACRWYEFPGKHPRGARGGDLGTWGSFECKPLTSYPATRKKQYDAAISNLRCPAN